MPREFDRSRRVQALVQRELADIIRAEVKDPRVGDITVSGVQVSRDLTHAKVFISALEPGAALRSAGALNNAAGFIRRILKQRLSMRSIPELRFLHDESIERGTRLYSLIEKTAAEDRERDESAPGNDEE